MAPFFPDTVYIWQNRPYGSCVISGHIRRLFHHVTTATRIAKSTSMPNRLVVVQQACLSIESKGYVVIVNEILVCEYSTECNVAPSGVRKLKSKHWILVM